jgi:hypothetical protein
MIPGMEGIKGTTNRARRLRSVLEQLQYSRIRSPAKIPLMEDPLIPRVQAILEAADGRKAADLLVLRVQELTEVSVLFRYYSSIVLFC